MTHTSYQDYCAGDKTGKYNEENYTELAVDIIILDYMRSIKLISIICFAVLCSPLMLCCWFINKPKPPIDVKEHLTSVTAE